MPSIVFPGLSVRSPLLFNSLVNIYKSAFKEDLITELFFHIQYADLNTLATRDCVRESKQLCLGLITPPAPADAKSRSLWLCGQNVRPVIF